MDDKLFVWWAITLKHAMDGDKYSQVEVRIQNQNREKDGLPTLEEEVFASAPEAERTKIIAQIRSAYKRKVDDLTPEQLEDFMNIIETGAKFGYVILDSVNSKKEWMDQVRPIISYPLKRIAGYLDFEIEEYLKEMWTIPYVVDDRVKTMEEWASEKGIVSNKT